jgi:hypothetical protein
MPERDPGFQEEGLKRTSGIGQTFAAAAVNVDPKAFGT